MYKRDSAPKNILLILMSLQTFLLQTQKEIFCRMLITKHHWPLLTSSLWTQNLRDISQKYLHLCPTEERVKQVLMTGIKK